MDTFSQRLRPAAFSVALTAATLSGCSAVPSFPDRPESLSGTAAAQALVDGRQKVVKGSLAQGGIGNPSRSQVQGANAPSLGATSPQAGSATSARSSLASTSPRPAAALPSQSDKFTLLAQEVAAENHTDASEASVEDEDTPPKSRKIQRTSFDDSDLPPLPGDRTRVADAKGKRPANPSFSQRLKIPPELPGAEAPPITLPGLENTGPETRAAAIDRLFPKLSDMAIKSGSQPTESTWTLAQFEQFALEHNPVLVQASSDIDAAAGSAYQAGMYPNPTIGYEADTVNSGGTLNYQGAFINQTIKTAGKLELARLAGQIDTLNAQLSLRKTRIDVLTKVRANYYGVLVAQENVRSSAALVRFTNEVYRVQVDKLQGGQSAPYEPMQLRALAVQARGALQQARNRYESAWRQLAAALGTPDLAPQTLAGQVDDGLPEVPYDAALAHIMGCHTDIQTAQNKEAQARINVRREEVVPIPDIGVYTAVQRDFTTPPVLRYTYNLQIGIPVPIFDRNRGGIQNAQAQLVRASEEAARVRNDLTAQLADAYERYETNRVLVEYYRKQILPDQARAYRGVYERHQQEEEQVGFGDIVVAQQNLLTSITSYLSALNSVWLAVTDIQGLMQRDVNQELTATPEGTATPVSAPTKLPTPATPLEPQPMPGAANKSRRLRNWTTGVKQAVATKLQPKKRVEKPPEASSAAAVTEGPVELIAPPPLTPSPATLQEPQPIPGAAKYLPRIQIPGVKQALATQSPLRKPLVRQSQAIIAAPATDKALEKVPPPPKVSTLRSILEPQLIPGEVKNIPQIPARDVKQAPNKDLPRRMQLDQKPVEISAATAAEGTVVPILPAPKPSTPTKLQESQPIPKLVKDFPWVSAPEANQASAAELPQRKPLEN